MAIIQRLGMLAPGTRIDVYEVSGSLGAGGMGEVYRARDTKLNRDVALKILPEAFATDSERRARFEREAQVLASLNHPHIGAIYGLAEAAGVTALVLELIEGQTLADRIARGPIPVVETSKIAVQIVDALDAAHEKGIIHRDLKPDNIKLTDDERVKVLDFGLAKLQAGDGAASGEAAPLSQSPTMLASVAGMIVGTAAYMAPEQAKGKTIDKRADVWSFGCVLYEMLTGTCAFAGDDVADVLVAVLTKEPDWSKLPRMTPPGVIDLLHQCLTRDPRERLRDIADSRRALTSSADTSSTPAPTARRSAAMVVGWVVAAAATVVAVLLARRSPEPPRPGVVRFAITPSSALPDLSFVGSPVAMSPDGRLIAYLTGQGAGVKMFVRSLDSDEPRLVQTADDVGDLSFSHDGRWLLYGSSGKLQKTSVSGGQAQDIAAAPMLFGAHWMADNTIVFSPNYNSGLRRVSGEGGTPEVLTTPDPKQELGHWWPNALPGGRAVIFTVYRSPVSRAQVAAYDFASRRVTVLVEGATDGRYVPGAGLVYVRQNALHVVPFDPETLRVSGSPTLLPDEVSFDPPSASLRASFSPSGSFAFLTKKNDESPTRLLAVDRQGSASPLIGLARRFRQAHVSPDGRRLALTIESDTSDIWVADLTRGTVTRITSGPGSTLSPVWTADSRQIVYATESTEGQFDLGLKSIDGAGAGELVLSSAFDKFPTSVSKDDVLAFTQVTQTGEDIFLMPLRGERKPRPFRQTRFNESQAAFSPDGRWIAYRADDSGRFEVYVEPAAGGGQRIPISSDGGRDPVWGRDGRTIFYRNGDALVAVALKRSSDLVPDRPVVLFRRTFAQGTPQQPTFDVLPDGRFAIVERDPAYPSRFEVVLNWVEQLHQAHDGR